MISEKVFADTVPRCEKEECGGLIKPGKSNLQDLSLARAIFMDIGHEIISVLTLPLLQVQRGCCELWVKIYLLCTG